MDRSKGMGEPMQPSNQDSIYSYLCLSACYGCMMGRMLLCPYPAHNRPSKIKTIPTQAARFTFCFSIFDHTYRRDMYTIYVCRPFTSFNL